jgi:predicted DNA-binding antitoxin AbrB/MazE fold protein
MSEHIQAIYENGVLRPLQPLDLPEGSVVEIRIIKVLEESEKILRKIENDLAKPDS